MAKQYGTYIGAPSIDWGKAIGAVSGALEDIGLERENQILEADRLTQEAQKKIASIEGIKTQSLQEYITAGAGQGRDRYAMLNKKLKSGEINQQRFNVISNNMQTDWSTLANTMKNFDATNQELLKRQNEGKASSFETYLAGRHASLSDLRNTFYTFGEDGHGYIAKIDPVSGKINAVPSMAIADPMNLMDESIDFDKLISADTKNIGDYITQTPWGAQGSSKKNNPLDNPNVQEMVNQLINKYTNSPRWAAQALTTYGEDYDFYETQEEKNQLIENYKAELKQEDPSLTDKQIDVASKDYESYLINVTLTDNNKYEPVLSKEQIEEARKIIRFQTEGRIDFSETKFKPVAPKKPLKGKEISQAAKSAETKVTTLNQILNNNKANSTDLQTLNDIFGKDKNKEIRIINGKYVVYNFDPNAWKAYDPDTKLPIKVKGKGVWKVGQDVSRLATWKNLLNFNTPGYSNYWDEAVKNLGQ